MNYAVVYIVAILLFATLYWVLRGKKHYTGPRIEVPKDPNDANGERPQVGQSNPSGIAGQDDIEPEDTSPLLADP